MDTHKARMCAEQPPLPASSGALISGGRGHPPVPGTGHPVFVQVSHGHHSAAPGEPVVFPVAHQAHLARRLRGTPPRPLIGRPAPLLCPPVIWNRPSTTWPAWWVNFSRHPFSITASPFFIPVSRYPVLFSLSFSSAASSRALHLHRAASFHPLAPLTASRRESLPPPHRDRADTNKQDGRVQVGARREPRAHEAVRSDTRTGRSLCNGSTASSSSTSPRLSSVVLGELTLTCPSPASSPTALRPQAVLCRRARHVD